VGLKPEGEGAGSQQLPLEQAERPASPGVSTDTSAPKGDTRAGSGSKGRTRNDRGRREDTKTQALVTDEGANLERRVARAEFAEGALTRMRVPVLADADLGRGVLTDIDVLAIDVDLRLRVSLGIHECKSGQGQAGEPDRLFWLAGFEQYVGADRSTLVRRTATRRGHALARRLSIRILDYSTLERREAAHAWLPERFAHVGGVKCTDHESRMEKQLKALREIPAELVAFLRHEAFLAPAYHTVGALLALRGAVERQGGLPTPTGEVLAAHALTSLFLAAVRDAGHLDVVPLRDLRTRLELALTVGSPQDIHVLDVLRNADAVVIDVVEQVHQAYMSRGAARAEVNIPSLREVVAEPPAAAIDRYLDLVERLRANPAIARDILQTVELACFDALPGDVGWKASAFDHLFTPEHRHLITAGARALGELAGEAIAGRLQDLAQLPFDRMPPALPSRTESHPR
jgi:hypothetical protein